MLKRIIAIFSISLIITGSFFSVYNIKYPVYADSNTDGWTQVTTNEQLVEAFRYYCKSRDLTIDGSIADGVTKFTTKTFNSLCNTLGINITAIQAHLKYQTDGNLGLRFLFDSEGISLYNRIFAQFLQDNNLSVGDSANEQDNILYSGRYFVDADGNGCLIYIASTDGAWNTRANITAYGSVYRFTGLDLFNSINVGESSSFVSHFLNGSSVTISYTKKKANNNANNQWIAINNLVSYQMVNGTFTTGGDIVILYFNEQASSTYKGKYYIANYNTMYYGDSCSYFHLFAQIPTASVNDQPCNIYITTNNTVINNNTYEGDTIINNNGTTGDDDDNPDTPDIPDPSPGPTPDPPTIPDSGGWQDFSLPDMPNDWLIYGMEKKFPFDIPFNILFALSLLNHEPEIPKFEGDIDLQVCTWHYDIDLTPFDDIATILRKFEVLGFIIGLAILTKNLINWG